MVCKAVPQKHCLRPEEGAFSMATLPRRIHTLVRQIKSVFIQPANPHDQIIDALNATLLEAPRDLQNAILLIVQVDRYADLVRRSDPNDLTYILDTLFHRLLGGTLSRDVAAYFGEGQFAVSLAPLRPFDENDALIIAGQIQDAFAIPIIHSKTRAKVTASIGCAIAASAQLHTGAALLEAARIAVGEAVVKGPSALRVYGPEMGYKVRLKDRLRTDARAALSSGALHAHYQPQIQLSTQAISGCEALARWNHAEFGMIAPADFLPVFEEANLMCALGRTMLRDALQTLKNWDDANLQVPSVSVNMCAEELSNPNILREIQLELKRHGLTPDRLVIEVLETVDVIDGEDPVAFNLKAISRLGCRIDLDDYGTGQTSIKSVRNFSVDRIKIDRSYITGIDHDLEQQGVVTTILKMARNLKVDTLAEGVETEEEIAHLRESGCDFAQGYAIARPLPASEALAWMKAHQFLPEQAKLDQIAP